MLGISRKPVAYGLRVSGRRLAGQIAVQQEIATLVVGVHAPITGQGRPDPQAYAACRALPRRIIRTPPSAVRGTTPTPRSESTRLNSSHVEISYAVFCLKKKK